jgi:putative SOS response-associated peptidase YedK
MIPTDAHNPLSVIQDRMPVIIEKGNWPLWLGEADRWRSNVPASRGARKCAAHLAGGPEVGNVRNDGPDLLEPRPLEEAPLLSPIHSSCPSSDQEPT